MYLDESILQSRTTQTLVEFIDEMWEFLEIIAPIIEGGKRRGVPSYHVDQYEDIQRKYLEVKERATKASKKRSFK